MIGFKRPKYGNDKVEYNGIIFDSKKERDRYLVLRDAERKGIISGLQRQVKYELIPPVVKQYVKHLKTKDKIVNVTLQRAITYTCDFQYVKDSDTIVEDVKSSPKMAAIDKVYFLKKKMMFYFHNIMIREVYKASDLV